MDAGSFNVKFLKETIPAHYIKDTKEAEEIVKDWQVNFNGVLFGLDTETKAKPEYTDITTAALSPHLGTIRLLQIYDTLETFVFDLDYVEFSVFEKFLRENRFIAHNAIFDLSFLNAQGVYDINIGCSFILSKILFHATYPLDTGLHASLEALTKALFGQEVLKVNQKSNWGEPDLKFEQIEYSALDPVACWMIGNKLAPGLEKYDLVKTYNLLKRAQHPIAVMQMNGIAIDEEAHRVTIDEWRIDLWEAHKKVLEITGLKKLTPKTLGDWLEAALDPEVLNAWPRTPTGKLATNTEAFSEFSHLPVIEPYAVYQKKKTLTATFGATLLDLINPETHRLHTSINLCGARTGRLSSSKPNFQNLPRDAEVRSHFVAAPGFKYVRADYNQIELRVAAELSRDEEMLNAYRNGLDLHTLTASIVSHIAIDDLLELKQSNKPYYDELRQKAKAVNFGLLFGLGSKKFVSYAWQSYGIRTTEDEASEIILQWRDLYFGYRTWQLQQAKEAASTLQVRTPNGKLRRLPEDNTYGTSMNTPVQGGAAECMLEGMIDFYNMTSKFYPTCYLVNCVHDELLVECEEKDVDSIMSLLPSCMTQGFLKIFPDGITTGLVEVNSGDNWKSAK